MRFRTSLAAILFASMPLHAAQAPALSASPATTQAADGIESLISLLSADSWQTRQDAQDKLVRLGESARQRLLLVLQQTSDPEVRTRAEAALGLIDENRAIGPTFITLNLAGAAPQDVLAEFSRQAFAPLKVWPENLFTQQPWPAVTIAIDNQPFWPALKELCAKLNLHPQNMGGDRGLVLVQGRANNLLDGPCIYCGPFMVVATGATQTNNINFAQPQNPSRSLNLSFMVLAEPKLQVIQHSFYAQILEAIDDKGNSLPGPRQYGESFNSDPSPLWPLNAMLAQPKDPGSKIVRLKGQSRVILQTRSETWEINDILSARPATRTINGRTFAFSDIKQAGNAYQVKLAISADRQSRFLMNSAAGGNGVQLLDNSASPLARRGNSSTPGDGNRIEYIFTFDRDADGGQTGPPDKLLWKLSLETRDIPIPFEFTNLPLP